MPKFGDIYINQFPLHESEGVDTFNVVFLKIGNIVKVGIGHAARIPHYRIVEQLLCSEKIFACHRQTAKGGKEIPRADFYDENTKKHGKILGCGNMTVDYGTRHIKFFGSSSEYGLGITLLEVRNFMDNYYSEIGFSYEVEGKVHGTA
jgi:hypothetical protein